MSVREVDPEFNVSEIAALHAANWTGAELAPQPQATKTDNQKEIEEPAYLAKERLIAHRLELTHQPLLASLGLGMYQWLQEDLRQFRTGTIDLGQSIYSGLMATNESLDRWFYRHKRATLQTVLGAGILSSLLVTVSTAVTTPTGFQSEAFNRCADPNLVTFVQPKQISDTFEIGGAKLRSSASFVAPVEGKMNLNQPPVPAVPISKDGELWYGICAPESYQINFGHSSVIEEVTSSR